MTVIGRGKREKIKNKGKEVKQKSRMKGNEEQKMEAQKK